MQRIHQCRAHRHTPPSSHTERAGCPGRLSTSSQMPGIFLLVQSSVMIMAKLGPRLTVLEWQKQYTKDHEWIEVSADKKTC